MRNHWMTFTDYIYRIDKFLSKKHQTDWNDKQLFYSISDKIGTHSPIYICCQNGSVQVGIGNTNEYYDQNDIDKALWRFLTLLTCKIKRTDFAKGKMIFKTKFETLEKNTKPYLAISATWLFPYWKRTERHETFQGPFYTIDQIETEFVDIKSGSA